MNSHSIRYFFHLILSPSVFFVFFFSYSQSFAAEPALQSVSVLLNWKHQFEFAGYYAAKEQGYYRDAGLDVTLHEFTHGTDVVGEVLSGNADFGVFYSDLFLFSVQGKPISLLANFLKYSPEVIVAHQDVRLPSDLKGKRVMGEGHELRGANLGAMLKQFGVSADDLIIVPHSFTVEKFISGEVDAMTVFLSNEIYNLKKHNIPYNILSPFSFGIPSYDGNLFTSSTLASSSPDMVRAFRDASIRGWQYAVDHPDEMIDLILAKYSGKKSREALQFEAVEILKATLHDTIPIGSVSMHRIRAIVSTYKELGLAAEDVRLTNLVFESFEMPGIFFSAEEEKYISEKNLIRFCVNPDWMPFEGIDKNGQLIGMSAEFIQMIAERIHLPLELVPTKTWKETIKLAKTKQCDFISLATQTEERGKYLNFTRPYLKFSEVIATKSDVRFIEDFATVLDRKHGIVAGYAHKGALELKYPGIQICEVDNVKDGLKQVQDGKLFSFIDAAATIAYVIERDALTDLKISGKVDHVAKMSIAVRKDDLVLLSIMEKVLANIGEDPIRTVYRKWVEVKYVPHLDYTLFIEVLAGVLVLFIVALYRNWKLAQFNTQIQDVNKALQKEIAERTEAEEKRCQLEKQLFQAQKMESIGLMASGVAHDLNNILSGIVGYPDLLLPDLPEGSKLRKPILAIQESGQRAVAVVADLLTVARGAASARKNCDIKILVDEHVDSPEFKKLAVLYPHVSFEMQFAAEKTVASCSPIHVKKCIMNLIINAAEAIDNEGIITVSITNEYVSKNSKYKIEAGAYVVLSVQDTGPGVSSTDLEHIFEPFYTKKIMGHSGSGLGLAVVWNTMEDHNGRVLVESDEHGTIFKLYFPLSDKPVEIDENKDTICDSHGNGEHILVVDDEDQLRDLASEMLKSKGYHVDSVTSGELAIEFVKKKPVDLLLLDMLMEPGINGRETFEKIRNLFPEQKAVVVSGFSESGDVKALLKLGVASYIKKPYTMEQLARAVQTALAG